MPDAPESPSAPNSAAPPDSNSVCTCSPTGGTCKVCRRRHRIAYGLVAVVAAVTLSAWAVVFFMTAR
jgi:hypothetical protein